MNKYAAGDKELGVSVKAEGRKIKQLREPGS